LALEYLRGLPRTVETAKDIPAAIRPEGKHPMRTDPDRIREEIRRAQQELSTDVDTLVHKASPTRMVHEPPTGCSVGCAEAKAQ
jgi:Protein of unknown function (DUF3618)